MAGTGGRRPGAGRKPKAEKYSRQIALAEGVIAGNLPDLINSLMRLANGQIETAAEMGSQMLDAFQKGQLSGQAGKNPPGADETDPPAEPPVISH